MSCFNLFLSSIYTAAQHTKNSFWTSFVSTVLNLILNIILIPKFGVHGAVATTFISYVVCYLIRIVDARRYIYFRVNHFTTFINISVLLGMSLLTIKKTGLLYNLPDTSDSICCVYQFQRRNINLEKGFIKRKRITLNENFYLFIIAWRYVFCFMLA